jgi:hypothetical protein
MISPDTSTIVAVLQLKDFFKGRKEHLLRIRGLFEDENFPCADAVWGTFVYEGGAPCEAAVGKGAARSNGSLEAWKRGSQGSVGASGDNNSLSRLAEQPRLGG